MVFMGVVGVREEVVKFTRPVVGEVCGELFKAVDVGIELEHVYQVDGELLDCECTGSSPIPGEAQVIADVQLDEEGEWYSFDLCKIEGSDFFGISKVLREPFVSCVVVTLMCVYAVYAVSFCHFGVGFGVVLGWKKMDVVCQEPNGNWIV